MTERHEEQRDRRRKGDIHNLLSGETDTDRQGHRERERERERETDRHTDTQTHRQKSCLKQACAVKNILLTTTFFLCSHLKEKYKCCIATITIH